MVISSFVPHIHKFCDRWCEQCPLSHRCSMAQSTSSEDETLSDLLEPLQPDVEKIADDIPALFRAEHPLADQSRAWFCSSNDWLATCFADSDQDPRAQTVAWHASVVLTKVGRAVCDVPQSVIRLESDAYGSAKVATLSLAKILDVLTLWCARHQLDRPALRLLEGTCELVEAIEREFPDHLRFRRPGFDTGALPPPRRYGPRMWLVKP